MSSGAVGIDLGTTFSAIAHVNQHGVPEILSNAEGDRITPSMVLFEEDAVIVGNYARQAAVVYPDQVVAYVKRHIGDADFQFRYLGEPYTPEKLSSFVLAKLKHDAELRLGHPVDRAVITVPAYFNDAQRRATIRAGELAGLRVLKLINEPTAAAFAYGLEQLGKDARILVFDLGGGTFDVTLVQLGARDIQVLATDGDHQLGGKDFDDRIVTRVAEAFIEKHGIDPRDDPASWLDLRQKCINAKISLSRRPRVNIFHDHEGKVLRYKLTREAFEDMIHDLLARCEELTRSVAAAAGVALHQVDTLLLVGGSTRMPVIRDMLEDVFGKAPATDMNPDEAVAMGAALTAAIEAAAEEGNAPPVDIRTQDVTSHSLGMVAYRDGALHNSRIIGKNTRVPTECARDDYVTTHDDQATMDLWLVQGEHEDPLHCTVLGHFEFYGIPQRPAGETRLSVTYRYNADGIVEVEAMDAATGQILPHRLAPEQVSLEDVAANRAPMQVALLIDCSGSMYGANIAAAKQSALSFCRAFLTEPRRELALVAFPGGVVSPPTSDRGQLEEALDTLTPMGSTPMDEGLYDARQLLQPRPGVQRVFVVLTDGHPDDPEATRVEVQKIRLAGARLVTIGVGDEVQRGFLEGLASQPSDFHFCGASIELEGTFLNVATELAPS